MIDWIASSELNKVSIRYLKGWFERYPGSGKRIVVICDNCGESRKVDFKQYSPICHKCVHRTPEYRAAARLKTIEQYSTQKARDDQAERVKQWHKNHPEWGESHSKRMIKYSEDPDVRSANSDRIKNSESAWVEHKRQRGGNDAVYHHYIYDDNDRSKYTIGMTRSDHQRLHRLLQKLGYIVPHINTEKS